MRIVALIALLTGACSFSPGAIGPLADAPPDGPPPITVGFAKSATATDEDVPLAQVRVVLSKPSDEPITVSFAVTGGTADRPSDYLLSDGILTFAPGDIEETIDITVGPDGMAEPDETIALTLSNVTGAGAVLVNSMHTVTISANTLPRVTFSVPTSAANETASPTIDVVLDKPSQLTTNVAITVMSGSATGGGTDYTLVTTTVTFDPGEVTQPVTLTVVNDTLDEPNEDVTLLLADPTNLVVGTESTRAHTINDDDAAPTVAFDALVSTVSEGTASVDIVVSLSAISGKAINVPFSVSSDSTATGGGTDYTLATASPLAFPAGTLTKTITITVVNDTAEESPETVVLDLGAPTPPPNATLGANTTHTLTIEDNDQTCLGQGATQLCFSNPQAAIAFSGAFNTDTNALCSATPPLSGWTNGPSACFVLGTAITVNGATTVTGSRPLVLFSSGNITVNGNLDVASHRGSTTGPGSNIGCSPYTDLPGTSVAGAGGGAGGTFRTVGGNGGVGNVLALGGGAVAAGTAPATLRGGCIGQKGGDGFGGAGDNGGDPGAGGGALYLVASGTISIASGVVINASGAGATALTSPDAGLYAGGGGGGSGGMVKLYATTFSVSGARIMANGGGGSTGADDNTAGVSGNDPSTSAANNPGTGGTVGNGGGNGGNGWGGTTPAEAGDAGGATEGGGGGGGGGGYIQANGTLTGAQLSAGEISQL